MVEVRAVKAATRKDVGKALAPVIHCSTRSRRLGAFLS